MIKKPIAWNLYSWLDYRYQDKTHFFLSCMPTCRVFQRKQPMKCSKNGLSSLYPWALELPPSGNPTSLLSEICWNSSSTPDSWVHNSPVKHAVSPDKSQRSKGATSEGAEAAKALAAGEDHVQEPEDAWSVEPLDGLKVLFNKAGPAHGPEASESSLLARSTTVTNWHLSVARGQVVSKS